MTVQKTYSMWYPGKTQDGKGTYLETPLTHATNRDEAKAIAMGIVRVQELTEMHLIEQPNELIFYAWPMKSSG